MKTVVKHTTNVTMEPQSERERELFQTIEISSAGVLIRFASGAQLWLGDSVACALLANLAQVAHRRLQEIELSNPGGRHATRGADADAVGAAVSTRAAL